MLRERNETEGDLSATKARGKLSYGWVTAAAGSVVMLAGGNFLYTFGVFVKPLIYQFGWSRAAISACVSIRNITTALFSPITGILGDRYEVKKLILIGIFMVGLSYLLASRITSLWQLYLFLGALTGIGMASFFVPIMATVTRWFGSKSALPNGIVLSGFGWAQIIIPPLATYLILQYSWETCFIILGIAAVVLGTAGWSFIKTPPNIMNQPPTKAGQGNAPEASATSTGASDDYPLPKALHNTSLWSLLLIQMVVAGNFQMVVVHIVISAIDIGATPEAAAIILTLNGVSNTSGRLLLSALATKIGNKTVLAMCLAVAALMLFLLAGASSLRAFYVIAIVYGLAYGGVGPLMPTLAGSLFGTRSLGSIFGTLNTAYTTGAAIGPFLAGYIFDVTGSYSAAFLSAAIATAIAFVLCLLLKVPHSKATAA